MQITLRGVGFAYPGAAEHAVRAVDATFTAGWTGIVGPNGCGKTTVAHLACGLLTPTEGSVSPASVSAAYCEQQVLREPPDLYDFACDWSGPAVRLRGLLAIDDSWPWRFDTLSGGERKRLQLACALASEPAALVLDEPTNFLDAPTRALVIEALKSYDGVGILISHDRELLDAVVQRCLFMEDGRCVMRPGSYSAGRAQADLERRSAQNQRAAAARELGRLEREAQRRRSDAARANANRSGRAHDPRDHDAREKLGRYLVSGQDGKRAKLSATFDGRVQEDRARLDAATVAKRYSADLWVETAPYPRKVLVRLDPAELPLGEDRVLQVPALTVGNAERIAVTGANGAGKSTLVRHLMAAVSPEVRVLYVPQEPDPEQVAAFKARLDGLDSAHRGRVLSIVAQLGSDPQGLVGNAATSPGELRKLMLAAGLLDQPQLIVMDEPANHLDVTSVEALQRALAGCPCALVVVSHDRLFVDAVATTRWEVGGGAVVVRAM